MLINRNKIKRWLYNLKVFFYRTFKVNFVELILNYDTFIQQRDIIVFNNGEKYRCTGNTDRYFLFRKINKDADKQNKINKGTV